MSSEYQKDATCQPVLDCILSQMREDAPVALQDSSRVQSGTGSGMTAMGTLKPRAEGGSIRDSTGRTGAESPDLFMPLPPANQLSASKGDTAGPAATVPTAFGALQV